MPNSPFQGLAENAVLIFTIADGPLEEDPNTGNMVPGMKTKQFTAFLKTDSRVRGVLEKIHPGMDELDHPLAGYLVNPLKLPAGIGAKSQADAVIDGRQGTFTLYLPIQSAFSVVTEILGHRIYGVFREQA